MTDHPTLFSAPMIRALLGGRKTQTRRILNPQPDTFMIGEGEDKRECLVYPMRVEGEPCDRIAMGSTLTCGVITKQKVKYTRGDRLYVRETWRVAKRYDHIKPIYLPRNAMSVLFEAGGSIANEGGAPWTPDNAWPAPGKLPDFAGKARVSIHLPRWASRMTLIVENVRIERLRDISEDDAKAEGALWHDGHGIGHSGYRHNPDDGFVYATARGSFERLWCAINGGESWDANPWVVAVTFRVEHRNIDMPAAAADPHPGYTPAARVFP